MSEPSPGPGSSLAPARAALRCEALVVPKGRAHECEDAHAWNAHRAVVCDGASRAFASGRWAALLARAFLAAELGDPDRGGSGILDGWLERARTMWAEETAQAADAPVYVRGALARGSAATFLGVDTEDVGSRLPGSAPLLAYRAFAVGDSCLFHLREGRPTAVFPLERPDQFDTHPPLVPTRAESLRSLAGVLRSASGACGPDDILLLTTDALAQWILESAAVDGAVWAFLEHAGADEFAVRVRELRRTREMKEDDVSLVRCRPVSTTAAPERVPPTAES